MSLKLILGGSGSGKSTRLFSKIVEDAQRNPDRSYIIIVPEQFTMQTQRELVMMSPAGGILNIDVLSFQRLAHRVFNETGVQTGSVLTETGKNLVIRRAAAGCRDRLTVMKEKLDQPGYVSEIKSILSELAQYEISDGDLDEMISLSEKRPFLQAKLQDLQILREASREYRKDKFVTGEELLDVFAAAAAKSELVKKSVFAFDGFTGFTPVQMNALRAIFSLAPEVRITLTMDVRERMDGKYPEHGLFALTHRSMQALYQLAEETHTRILEPEMIRESQGRFKKGSALEHMERNLLRYSKRGMPQSRDGISLHVSSNPAAEVRFAARKIRKLMDEEQMRCSSIAVITGDPTTYADPVRRTFREYGIPFFIDETASIGLNPCLEFIRGALEMMDRNFSYESVFRFLRCGCVQIPDEDIDRLENCVLAMGIRGRNRWEMEWTGRTRTILEEETAACTQIRGQLMEKLGPFVETFSGRGHKVSEYAEALYDLLDAFDVEAQMRENAKRLREAGEEARAREYEQVFGAVVKLLDEVYELLGDEVCPRKEFAQILEAGFSDARIGVIPPGLDEVHVGDMERTRLSHVKVLFFLGANDGWIPKREEKGGIMSTLERDFLDEAGIVLAPGERESGFIQRFYLYLCLTKPSDRLYLSRSRGDSDGKSMRPSYLLKEMMRMFPGLEETDEDEADRTVRTAGSDEELLSVLADQLREAGVDGEIPASAMELMRKYLQDPAYSVQVRKMADAAFGIFGQASLSEESARLLYGDQLQDSVTRLEQFASCAFEHFAGYGLSLKEREVYRVKAADLGNIFHQAMEMFSKKMQEQGYSWFTVSEEVVGTLLDQSVDESVKEYGAGMFFDTARSRYSIERIRRIVHRSVWATLIQIRAGKFEPALFEAGFVSDRHLDGDGQRGRMMRLRGRIDRIDTYTEGNKEYVKVVDYKSGGTTFNLPEVFYGLQLQLAVYLAAAMEMEQHRHPDREIYPAGLFYYRLQDPLIAGTAGQTREQSEAALLGELKPSGLMNSSDEVIDALDSGFEKESKVIPASRTKDGRLGARSAAVTDKQMAQLLRFVKKRMDQLGIRILDGEIAPDPYKLGSKEACEWCAFKDLCGFDPRLPGCRYRLLNKQKEEEIWQQIDEESGDGE